MSRWRFSVGYGRAAQAVLAAWLGVSNLSYGQQLRGVWADAFHEGIKSSTQIGSLVSRAVTGRYNALFVQVLPYQDQGWQHGAYWTSAIVPKSTDISSGFDPLATLCTQAQAAGLQVHVWLVPFRACEDWPPAGNATLAAHPEWICVPQANIGGGPALTDNDFYMLDPGSPDVQNYLVDIVRELVTNYPIDGVHLDYIRYTGTDSGYPSDNAYSNSGLKRFQRITGYVGTPPDGNSAWNDFRRRSISELVRRLRAEIPGITSNPRQPVRYSASLLATGNAPANFTSSLAYLRFQDWRLWMEQGWLDTACPMNYKEEHCNSQGSWYDNWVQAAMGWRYGRHMVAGQATYLNTFANSIGQMQYSYGQGVDGVLNYSYVATKIVNPVCDSGWATDWTWYNHVASNLYTAPATVPTMPWRSSTTATEGTVWGRVFNYDNGQYVDNATVQVGNLPTTHTYTDGNGYFVATRVPATAAGTNYTITTTSGPLQAIRHSLPVIAGEVRRYDLTFNVPAPWIGLDKTTIHKTVELGQLPNVDSFGVFNTNPGEMTFTIEESIDWLDVFPLGGTSHGSDEVVAVSIGYGLDGLPIGTHQGTIQIVCPDAGNSPRSIQVTVQIVPPVIAGDFDHDGDVDMTDFSHLQLCLRGPGLSPVAGCEDAALDPDLDVDGDDVTAFIGCMSGQGIMGDPDCL